jgi:hypothetical protein
LYSNLIQTVILLKNTGTALIKSLENFRFPTYDQVSKDVSEKIKNEVNSLKHTKITIGISAQIRSNILNQVNTVCHNATPSMLKVYTDNPSSIGIASKNTSLNITNNLNSQLSTPSAPSSVGWSSLF